MVSLLVTATPTTSRPQPTTARFVLSSWDYPDEYGQGIEYVKVYQNGTGSYVELSESPINPTDDAELEVDSDGFLQIRVLTWLNKTYCGIANIGAAYAIFRHSINVTLQGENVFSQQNFTKISASGAGDPLFWFYYQVIIDFLPISGRTYVATIEYDLYLVEETEGDVLTATSGSTDAGTPTGDYTDTHSVNGVFFGGTDPTDMYVTLWVEFSEELGNFNYSIYWNGSTSCNMFVYDHDAADWAVLDLTPNGENGPLAWDNGTVENEDYYNTTHVGFKLWDELNPAIAIHVDYLHIQGVPVFQWNTVATLSLVFVCSYSEEQVFLGNFFFIVLGLVMVPASTIYLVYGGRDKLTQDKFFYFLIAFIIGWAFIIGGVMP